MSQSPCLRYILPPAPSVRHRVMVLCVEYATVKGLHLCCGERAPVHPSSAAPVGSPHSAVRLRVQSASR